MILSITSGMEGQTSVSHVTWCPSSVYCTWQPLVATKNVYQCYLLTVRRLYINPKLANALLKALVVKIEYLALEKIDIYVCLLFICRYEC